MNTKAIIFDKDGTLIDFDAFWVTVSEYAVDDILKELKVDISLKKDVFEAFGITDGVTSINGVLCYGTYQGMGNALFRLFSEKGYSISEQIITDSTVKAYHKYASMGILKAACPNITGLMEWLHKNDVRIVLATNDDIFVTESCLRGLGIYEYFDKIYTYDSGLTPKPAPDIIHNYLAESGFHKNQVVMVGDTLTDYEFANGAGIEMIGVASCQGNKDILTQYTETVIPDISHLKFVLR